MNKNSIGELISSALQPEYLQVNSPDDVHFEVVIVSEMFIGQSRVKRQQMVYAILTNYIQSGELHALTMQTLTSAEWQSATALL